MSTQPKDELDSQPVKPRPIPRPRNSDVFGCIFCPGESFRRSRLRPRDFSTLMKLRYPVRCLRCSQRQLVSFALAGLSVPASVKHHRVRTDAESWKTWTTGDISKPARPNSASPAAPAYPMSIDSGPRPRRKPTTPKPQRDRSGDIW